MERKAMRNDILKIAAVAATVAPSISAASQEGAAVSSKRPNIVFFEVDDLLYRFLGKCGNGFVETPNIDALAGKGVHFTNAVCQGMMCGPSRNSLISGLYPHNLGFYRNGQMGNLQKGIWTMPAAVRRAGYETAWVGKCHVRPYRGTRKTLISKALVDQMGFDYAVASLGRAMLASRAAKGAEMKGDVYIEHLKSKGLLETYVNDCKNKAKVTSLPEDDYLDGFYVNTALKWLDGRDGKKPFFLWLNLSCPHGPYDCPQKYHDIYKGKKIPPPLTNSFGEEMPEGLLKDNRPAKAAKAVEEHRRGMAANVSFVDAMFGKVVAELDKKGILDDTVIFFFSDQGVFMGNHGRFHKGAVFNEITDACLIISYSKFKKGAVDKHPVELLDVDKTAMEIAGASEKDMKIPFGESLMPLLTGKGEYKRRYAFSEIEGFQSCFDGRYRYINNKEKPLLYDLQKDPGEMKNIAKENPELLEKMRDATKKWFERTGAPLPARFLRQKKNLDNWKRPLPLQK